MKEQDIIVLTKPVKSGKFHVPAGQVGTIVHVNRPRTNSALVQFGNVVIGVHAIAMRPEHTCIHCGCTDSKACAGGCSWTVLNKHTPTGICSRCRNLPEHLTLGSMRVERIGDKVWIHQNGGESMATTAAKLKAAIEQFFNAEF